MRLDPSVVRWGDLPELRRTRAGLGSGLELVIAGEPPLNREVWVNVPVAEKFVRETPFLFCQGDGYEIVDCRDGERYTVRAPKDPEWYTELTSTGTAMRDIGTLQGTYLGVYVGDTCVFWRGRQKMHCRFCTTGLNVDTSVPRTVADVVETARMAKERSGVTFVHLNTGFQGGDAVRMMAPYVAALKRDAGVLVGVQAVPEGQLRVYDHLIDLGCDHFSFCYEYHSLEFFSMLCPGKQATVGQEAFFEALRHCQKRMPKGACSGEIIVGNEPLQDTLDAIEFITGLGAFPTVCIFRPLIGSDMEDWPPPSYDSARRVMKHVWDCCRDHAIPVGLAPNIQVSLVVQPMDAAYLADRTWRDSWYLFRLGLLRRLAARHFRRRMAPAR